MTRITEREFDLLCRGIRADADKICRHNPLGTREEILLWMLLGVLVSYLNLSEIETPCFTGATNAETYRRAIEFVLQNRQTEIFDAEPHLREMLAAETAVAERDANA